MYTKDRETLAMLRDTCVLSINADEGELSITHGFAHASSNKPINESIIRKFI
jgi:hypothetical protein